MKKALIVSLVLFAVLSAAGNIYLVQRVLASAQPVVDDSQKYVIAIGKLMDLPTDESPTIAMVGDPEQLKQQGVFTKPQMDDVVLIYPKAKRAILYRPSSNKIIEVTSVNITDKSPESAASPAPAPAPTPAPLVPPTTPVVPAPVTP
jgi:hypothetical protein